MDAIAHVDAIEYYLENLLTQESAVALSSRLGVTNSLLKVYDEKMSKLDSYRLWFANAQIRNRFVVVDPKKDAQYKKQDDISEYIGLAYRFGQRYLYTNKKDEDTHNECFEYGINGLLPDSDWAGCINEDGVSFDLKFLKGDAVDLDVLKRVFRKESKVVLYDKYVNDKTLECLACLCEVLAEGAKVVVCISNRSSVDKVRVENEIHKNRNDIIVEVKKFVRTEKIEHDRYLFLGNRLQLWMSNGFDAFDCNKNVAVSDIRITGYNVYHSYNFGKIIPHKGKAEIVRVVKE